MAKKACGNTFLPPNNLLSHPTCIVLPFLSCDFSGPWLCLDHGPGQPQRWIRPAPTDGCTNPQKPQMPIAPTVSATLQCKVNAAGTGMELVSVPAPGGQAGPRSPSQGLAPTHRTSLGGSEQATKPRISPQAARSGTGVFSLLMSVYLLICSLGFVCYFPLSFSKCLTLHAPLNYFQRPFLALPNACLPSLRLSEEDVSPQLLKSSTAMECPGSKRSALWKHWDPRAPPSPSVWEQAVFSCPC